MGQVLGCHIVYLLEANIVSQQKCEGKGKSAELGLRTLNVLPPDSKL